jgi:2-haloacid dehalogenase
VTVFSLTNFGIESFAYAQSQYDFLKEFDQDYVSGRMRVIKPDPEIYEILEHDSGIEPSKLLFTDDRADNIAMAASRGWQTHLFEGAQGWADRLVDVNLLSVEQAR